jgi:micrococcal nuclease
MSELTTTPSAHRLTGLAVAALCLLSPALAGCFNSSRSATPATGGGRTVVRVVDGDTLLLDGGERVRVIGIDAPENTTEVECYGPESTEALSSLATGKRVVLVADAEPTDRYGRTLAYVEIDGTDLGAVMLAQGMARTMTIAPNTSRAAAYDRLAGEARASGLGLWVSC